ncbi:uncharacterized protein LOC143920707 [Arctopsyche grandis]|uniref:uncharacterized protein LOC143920707 n=1 Tax=Arctopsyche grandis TaxID=121162 RepID=UPI00406D9A6A
MLVFKFSTLKLWISICHYIALLYTWLLVLLYLHKCWAEERFRFQHEKKQMIMTLEEQQVLRRKARGLPSYTYSVPLALVDSDEEDEMEAFESTDLIDEKIQLTHSNGNLDENLEISKSLSPEKVYTSTNDHIVDQFVQIILFIVEYNEKFEPCLEPMNQDRFKCTFLHPSLDSDCTSDHSFFIHKHFHSSSQFRKGNILKYEEDYPGIFHKAKINAISSQSLRTIRDIFE